MEELVSIIIPAFNPPIKLFKNCLNSIQNQSYKNYEVIIVNDGSCDENVNKMSCLISADPKISILHSKHKGASAARNMGIDHARGKYFIFMDADDLLPKEWLQQAISYAEKEEADIVYGIVEKVSGIPKENNYAGNYIVYEQDELWKIQEALLCPRIHVCPQQVRLDRGQCGKLFRKTFASDVRFPEGIKISEDQVFNHVALRQSRRCVVCDMIAYYYVYNAKSVSHSYHSDAVTVMIKSMKLIQQYLFEETKVRQAYHYRIIDEMLVAFQLAYLNNIGNKNIKIGIPVLEQILDEPLVNEALHDSRIYQYRGGFSLFARLLKNKHYKSFIFLKKISWKKAILNWKLIKRK